MANNVGYVNVNRGLNDQFYRYKMPRLIAKVEGKGNGIKTVIVNMSDIAKALCRPPTYPTKYFGCELGSQTQFDPKKDRYIVNGQHDGNKLQDILDGFIRKYVLCPSCDNPETVLGVLPKRQLITTKCKACGHSGTLDTNHKLNTFILKNPPEGAKNKDAKTPKKGKDKKKDGDSPNNSGEENELGGDNNNQTPQAGDEDDDDWGEDTSAEAARQRLAALSMGAKGLMMDGDLERAEKERVNIFYEFVKERMPITSAVYKEILAESERVEVQDKAVLVLAELLLDGNAAVTIKQHRALFRLFTDDNTKAQKYLMKGVELAIKDHQEALLKKTATILSALFDSDIVDEAVFFDWSKRASSKTVGKELAQQIHDKAHVFIKWLHEAEEEESSEEEGADLEIEYNDRHTTEGLVEVKEPPKPVSNGTKSKNNANEEDDLDIDAI